MRHYPHEVEADLLRFYPGRRIGEWWRGEMSTRELWVLISQLPPESSTKAAQREDPWALDQHLLASLVDAVRHLEAQYVSANGGRSDFEPLPRPAQERERQAAQAAQEALHALIRGDLTIDAPTDTVERATQYEVF